MEGNEGDGQERNIRLSSRTNGVPYIVYKKCPTLLIKLWQLFRVIWRKGTMQFCAERKEL